MPDDFNQNSFDNKNLKNGFGESLNEVDKRFNNFIDELVKSDKNSIALFIHGIILMSYLQNNSKFNFDGRNLKIEFNSKVIYDDKMKSPLIFKLEFDDNNNIFNIKHVECD